MINNKSIYIHGLQSNSQSKKARRFAQLFPGIEIPDFVGSFQERMNYLYPILGNEFDWTIIGSSYGGLMGAVFTCKHPEQVRKLVLLAPALLLPEFASQHFIPIDNPVVLVHGAADELMPPIQVRELAAEVFTNLEYIAVEDDHKLHNALEELDWKAILA